MRPSTAGRGRRAGRSGGRSSRRRREVLEAREAVRREKVVDVGQRRAHPARERFVVRRAGERVQPDETVAAVLQARDLAGQQGRIAPIPAVADEQDDRAAGQHAAAPAKVEFLERLADARPAGPVGNAAGDLAQGHVRVAARRARG